MRVAVIPARGGSKRVPRKNIREFCGGPIIRFAIEAAKKVDLFDRVIVSTDDEEISEVVVRLGAETPFVRPPELADDFTPTVPVIAHAIRSLQEQGTLPDEVCCIYPCVPFLSPVDLMKARDLISNSESGYSYPVAEFPSAVQRALRLLGGNRLEPIHPEHEWTRTQDLEKRYYDAGQFYWGNTKTWLSNLGLQSNGVGLVIPSWRVVDIDTLEDWRRAETMFRVTRNEVER